MYTYTEYICIHIYSVFHGYDIYDVYVYICIHRKLLEQLGILHTDFTYICVCILYTYIVICRSN